MTTEQRMEIDYIRRTTTKLEFALMSPVDELEASLYMSGLRAAVDRLQNAFEGTPEIEPVATNAKYY